MTVRLRRVRSGTGADQLVPATSPASGVTWISSRVVGLPRGEEGRMADPASAAGRLVAAPLGALARLRRSKPMHPRGAVFDGVLERTGGGSGWGVPWLDGH